MTQTHDELEQLLVDALQSEADKVSPAPDAWDTLQLRIGGDELAARRTRRRRAQGVVGVVIAAGIVAASTIVAVTTGVHRDAVPDPAQTVGTDPSVAVPFDPSAPRTTWTIYRAGKDRLYVDQVRATAPYDPTRAFDALFSVKPTEPGPLGVEADGRNAAASLTSDGTVIRLDLSARDAALPAGTNPDVAADLQVQAWVHTAQEIYNTDLPVKITLHGRPTTLFGTIDTTQAIPSVDVKVTHTPGIYLPGPGEKVTSPLTLSLDPGAGDWEVQIRRAGTSAAVFSHGVSLGDSDITVGVPVELPVGTYEMVVRREGATKAPPAFSVAFEVTGTAPVATSAPVSNPVTSPVARVALSWPLRQHSGLLGEWRPRTSAESAVAALSSPGDHDVDRVIVPWRGRVGSVVRNGSEAVVDFETLDNPAATDRTTALRWERTLAQAVDAYYGEAVRTRVLLRGQPVTLFGFLDSREPVTAAGGGSVTARPVGLFSPARDDAEAGGAVIVGAASPTNTSVTWYVDDPTSLKTLYQGVAQLDDQHTYGFRLALPPGSYTLSIEPNGGSETAGYIYPIAVR